MRLPILLAVFAFALCKNSFAAETQTCSSLTENQRQIILSLADPANFVKTHYKKGPRYGRNIEKEADCSSFVHEIYKRAGIPFSFQNSSNLKYAPEFTEIPEEEAAPGDLMLFHGHVGIVADDGEIISATHNRKKRNISSAASAIKKLDRRFFKGKRIALRYSCNRNTMAKLKP